MVVQVHVLAAKPVDPLRSSPGMSATTGLGG